MKCERCGLEKDASGHDSAGACAVALRQHLQTMYRELEVARRTGTFDAQRLDDFDRENRRLLTLIGKLELEAGKPTR